jgi:hypothetical protein
MHISNHSNDSRYDDGITTDTLTELSQDNYIFHQRKRTGEEEADADVVETHQPFTSPSYKRHVQYDSTVTSEVRVSLTWPRTSCWPWNRFTRELRSLRERSSAAQGAQLTLRLLWLSGVALSWKMKDSRVALLLQHEHQISSLLVEIYGLVSIPTACSTNQFPSGRNIQPGGSVPTAC